METANITSQGTKTTLQNSREAVSAVDKILDELLESKREFDVFQVTQHQEADPQTADPRL